MTEWGQIFVSVIIHTQREESITECNIWKPISWQIILGGVKWLMPSNVQSSPLPDSVFFLPEQLNSTYKSSHILSLDTTISSKTNLSLVYFNMLYYELSLFRCWCIFCLKWHSCPSSHQRLIRHKMPYNISLVPRLYLSQKWNYFELLKLTTAKKSLSLLVFLMKEIAVCVRLCG